MSNDSLKLTHLFLLDILRKFANTFYRELLEMYVCEVADHHIFFDGGGCILATREQQVPNMPTTVPAFTAFEASDELETWVAELRDRGAAFYGPIQEQPRARIAWFSGPYDQLHCLW